MQEKNKKLLVVIDYQNDFVTGALKNEAAQKLEAGIENAVKQALDNGEYVLFTRDTHENDYLKTREGNFLPIEHCIKGTHGHNLYGSLAKYEKSDIENVCIVDKPTFGSFDLCEKVRGFCGGSPQEITVCGVVTDICVISNSIILHSGFLNATINVRSDLCAAGTIEGHDRALAVLGGMGYNIVSKS